MGPWILVAGTTIFVAAFGVIGYVFVAIASAFYS